MARDVKVSIGVEKNLQEITVSIPDHEPNPWHGAQELKHIGQRRPRTDGTERATGKLKYTTDIQLPGMLYAKFLLSPIAAGKITKVDISQAKKAPGVKAIKLVGELPFSVRYHGQEILAVAAKTAEQAAKALKLVKIEYQEKTFVCGLEKAMESGAPQVFDKGNKTTNNRRGFQFAVKGESREKVEQALADSHTIVEGTYRTQVQTHSALEPHGAVAKWQGEQLTVWISTQSIFRTMADLSAKLGIAASNLKVISHFTGGGFGAKFSAGTYGIMAAQLAKETGKPVRLIYSRKEEHLTGGNRPSTLQHLTLGADSKGKLQAIKLTGYGCGGVAPGGGNLLDWAIKNVYSCDKTYTEVSDVFANTGPGTAFRAPGHPQGIFALEQAIDELAYKVKADPLELRMANSWNKDIRAAEYEIGKEKIGWNKRIANPGNDKGPIKRGIGVANSVWYYFYLPGYQAQLTIYQDGSVELTHGVQDIGTGTRTIIAMILAEELTLPIDDLKIRIGESDFGYSAPSGGSQVTGSIAPNIRQAAFLAKKKMKNFAASLLKIPAEQVQLQDGRFSGAGKSHSWKEVAAKMPGNKFSVIGEREPDCRNIYPYTSCGVQFADIEVDTETGIIEVKRIVAVHDCGRPMNKLLIESQINGGVIQGLSYALFEDCVIDQESGAMLNANYEQYKIAGSIDMPEIVPIVIDVNNCQNNSGAIGVGEPVTVPTAAAIANAFYHATGVRIKQLPMTPEKVLAALSS